jgi:hypothetical protein
VQVAIADLEHEQDVEPPQCHRTVEVRPPSGDLEVGLVDEPAVPGDMSTWPGDVDQLGG